MDLLTDLLQQAGLRRRLLDLRRLGDAAALEFPCDRSLGLHVVMRGRAYVHGPSLREPLALQAGDMAVMARGCHHVLSTVPTLQSVPVERVQEPSASPAPLSGPTEEADADTLPAANAVISGAYQLWHEPVHPFFRQIPHWFVLRAHELPRLGPLALTVGLLDDEVSQRPLGADTIVHGLLDVIFTYLLREMVSRLGEAGASWSHAVRDTQVRHAVVLMHGDCARPWTLDELAGRVGLSRTALAERFRQTMGDTPLSHLRALRIQKAMRILSETDRTLEQVAQEVGYQDAFSFSKVFKRLVGVAPREFRRQDAADQALPWRIQAG